MSKLRGCGSTFTLDDYGGMALKTIWNEKYRPDNFDDFIGQEAIVDEIKAACENDSVQNYIFYSPQAGTGKTTLARIVANVMDWEIHTFNASSKKQRGIEFIEEEVAPLSRSGHECVILLDEADRITPQAQDALKGVIENATCVFILTCNDLSKVSPWLQSRCQVRHFQPLTRDQIVSGLQKPIMGQGVSIHHKYAYMIADLHEGDLRNAINCLQAYDGCGSQGEAFLRSLADSGINVEKFLRFCFKDKELSMAYGLLDSSRPRQSVREVFRKGIEGKASAEAKMKLIDASVVAERDLIMGVEPNVALWNYVRMLVD